MSAPHSSGRCSIGVAKALSSTTLAPALCARSHTALMSTMSSIGLDGDSNSTACVGFDSAFSQCCEVAAVDELARDAVLGQQLGHDVVAGAEELARRDDAVARLEQRQQREEHRRHAGRGGAAGLGAFERGQPVLEHADGRIAEARILVVRALALEGGLGLLGALVGVARGQEQRLRRLVEVAAQLAAAHGARLRPPRRLIGASPSSLGSIRPLPSPRVRASKARNEKAPDLEGRGLFSSTSDLLAMFNVVASRSAQISTRRLYRGEARRSASARSAFAT